MKLSKILNLSLALLCMALFSCAPTTKPEIKRHVFSVVVQEVSDLQVHGTQEWSGNRCVIKLREYPKCLQHEVRHCIEGNWHEGKETTEDCFY